MSLGIEDCIAMSEDGDWYAFHRDGVIRRPQVMAAIARQDGWDDFHEAITTWRVRVGWVVESDEYPGRGWWSQCDFDTPGAVPAWVVTRRT
jgi:hypothetical protein